jgi:hypothetical protein
MISAGIGCNKCNTPLKGYCIAYPRHYCVCEYRKVKTCRKAAIAAATGRNYKSAGWD